MFMNKEGPYRDQAERLRKRITMNASEKTDNIKEELPPRSRVHRNKKVKKGLKVKYPMIRLLALFFVLLPVIIFVVYTYANWGNSETTTASSGFETVGYGSNSDNQNKPDSEVIFEIDEQMDENEEEQSAEVDEQQTAEKTEEKEAAQQTDEADSNKSDDQTSVQNKEPAEVPKKQDEKPSKDKNTENSEQAGGKIVYHTVKAQETLYRVSINYFSSSDGIEIIKKANGLTSNEIQAGQVLKIPLNQ